MNPRSHSNTVPWHRLPWRVVTYTTLVGSVDAWTGRYLLLIDMIRTWMHDKLNTQKYWCFKFRGEPIFLWGRLIDDISRRFEGNISVLNTVQMLLDLSPVKIHSDANFKGILLVSIVKRREWRPSYVLNMNSGLDNWAVVVFW